MSEQAIFVMGLILGAAVGALGMLLVWYHVARSRKRAPVVQLHVVRAKEDSHGSDDAQEV